MEENFNQNTIIQNEQLAQMPTAIILAGGLGTRLRNSVPDLPKCMAPVAGFPFLYYVINHLQQQGIQKMIFSIGYMHEVIEKYLKAEFSTLDYEICVEEEPLGTGGAIQFAMQKVITENAFVCNGDTLFRFDADELLSQHLKNDAECTLALKRKKNFDRYGVVELNNQNIIKSFKEKQPFSEGLINAGLYLINKDQFLSRQLPYKFSFEKDYLEKFVSEGKFFGLAQDKYFIDIGISEDFNKAQKELSRPAFDLKKIDKSWTLFLDRDGVINEDRPNSYVFNADDFIFFEGVPEAFRKLSRIFKHIFVATNQRGVGKGLMSQKDLDDIHKKMNNDIEKAGGKIDKIYYCTNINNNNFDRKPNPGMALRAKEAFHEVDLSKSIMVGNNISDMQFGRAAGMYTVFVTTTLPEVQLPHPYIDLVFNNLNEFVDNLP
ncbi:MAG TPA: HAD-IIIA family hydrolase [Niabella sp.]|jgi:D-glycero-alpha-D-manno-heptose 1-phosphate guanylyltransferase|nr:HAD-IIIA family hydrolase [Chitinophagaceae bacterium]HRN47410.1 HAD-IIIA family hydrolase [Niabella sp.]HRO84287.1 HAD-IIIA family hydrolase [Niabella sp.]